MRISRIPMLCNGFPENREPHINPAPRHRSAPPSVRRPRFRGRHTPLALPVLTGGGNQTEAIHVDSYLNRVEFFTGNTRIGESEIWFFRAPDPGTPIHHQFEWLNPPTGEHVLTARAATGDKETITSATVRITVGPSVLNAPPSVAITAPSAGDSFPAGVPVPIVVESRDPDGFVPRMEFFADGSKIGEQNINFFTEPPPNQLQTFQFVWENPMPGPHVLTVRSTDSDGAGTDSAPVGVSVVSDDGAIHVVDEPTPGAAVAFRRVTEAP